MKLRTPLNAILGFAQVLDEDYYGKLNEKQLEYVKNIYDSGNHLLELINKILDLSKIEAERMELSVDDVDLVALARESLTIIRQKAEKKGIRLAVETEFDPEESPHVLADELRIKQVLYNLLANSEKFTPEGGSITIHISAQDRNLLCSVLDTGIGIAPEFQKKIFEPFFQVKGDAQTAIKGTGLGISVSQQIVELHGGQMWVESEGKGQGSRFCFTLPKRFECEAVGRVRTIIEKANKEKT